MFAIIFTFIFMYTSFRRLRRAVHVKLLLNLSFALLGLYVTFSISTVSTGVPVLCGVVSALIHYFFLAVFFWMAAEAIQLHRKLVTVFKPDITSYVTIAMAICWGRLVHGEKESKTHILCTILPSCTILPPVVVPAFIVVFSLAPYYQNYIHPQL